MKDITVHIALTEHQADIQVARDLMPFLHRSTGEILFTEFWVVDSRPEDEDPAVLISMYHIPAVSHRREVEEGTYVYVFLNTETKEAIVLRNPPLALDPERLIATNRDDQRKALRLLLEWFQVEQRRREEAQRDHSES